MNDLCLLLSSGHQFAGNNWTEAETTKNYFISSHWGGLALRILETTRVKLSMQPSKKEAASAILNAEYLLSEPLTKNRFIGMYKSNIAEFDFPSSCLATGIALEIANYTVGFICLLSLISSS